MKQTEKYIRKMYQDWRRENNNQKPNRAIIKMYWEDGDNTEKGYQVDTVAIQRCPEDGDSPMILWYAGNLKGLLELLKPDNGSDFVMTEVLEFYKA